MSASKSDPHETRPPWWGRRSCVFLLVLYLSALISVPAATQSVGQERKSKGSPAQAKPVERLAMEILVSAEGEAKAYSPPVTAHCLLQIARAVSGRDPARAQAILKRAFRTTLFIEDVSTKELLQGRILDALLPMSRQAVENLLPSASREVRLSILQRIVGSTKNREKLKTYMHTILQLTSEGEFPYGLGMTVMKALPPGSSERQELFAAALASYRDHSHDNYPQFNDFGAMVARFGEDLPRELVLEAITEVLKQAKGSKDDTKFQVTATSKGGATSFSSTYEYRIAQMLPLLRKLDPPQADKFVRESPILATADVSNEPVSMTFRVEPTAATQGEASVEEVQAAFHAKGREIAALAKEDPYDALTKARELPNVGLDLSGHSPKADALEGIARIAIKQNRMAASTALAELQKTITEFPPLPKAQYLVNAISLYLQIGDTSKAENLIAEGLRIARKLYDDERDREDPNQAPKTYWPSTSLRCGFGRLAVRISPAAALDGANEIEDPEMRLITRVCVANAVLDLASVSLLAIDQRKKGLIMHRAFDVPGTMKGASGARPAVK
jgi:hypothetical protein